MGDVFLNHYKIFPQLKIFRQLPIDPAGQIADTFRAAQTEANL